MLCWNHLISLDSYFTSFNCHFASFLCPVVVLFGFSEAVFLYFSHILQVKSSDPVHMPDRLLQLFMLSDVKHTDDQHTEQKDPTLGSIYSQNLAIAALYYTLCILHVCCHITFLVQWQLA